MNQNLKRIVLTLGGKGGTGKTLFCRLLYYYLVNANVNCLAYDADIENPEFEEYHVNATHRVEVLNFLDVGEAKQFFTALDQQQPEVALLDMPGASGKQTREQIQKFGLFQIAKQLGYRTTIATVLNNAYNTVNSLDIMLNFCGENTDYVVVKSQLWNQGSLTFDRWQQSETRDKFLQLKGIEIEMPVLELTSFDALHEESLSFFDRKQLSFGDRILVDSFLDLSHPHIEAASAYLGIPTALEKKSSTAMKAEIKA